MKDSRDIEVFLNRCPFLKNETSTFKHVLSHDFHAGYNSFFPNNNL